MPIQGLTNQWASYDGLLARFSAIPDDDASGTLVAKHRMIRELLAKLHEATDSIVYVGTSHSTLNFATRDAAFDTDRTEPFAFVDVVIRDTISGEYTFRVETRVIDGDRPTSKWIVCKTIDVEAAARIVREALLYADVPRNFSGPNSRLKQAG